MRYLDNPSLYEQVRALREDAEGRCTDCHVTSRVRGKRCAPCYGKHRARMTSRYEKLRALGICTQCGVVPSERSQCGSCAQAWKERKIARDEAREERAGG